MFSSNVLEHETEATLFNEQGMLTEDGIKEMVEEEPALVDFRSYLEGIYSQDSATDQVTMFKDQGKSDTSSKDYSSGSGGAAVLERPPPTESGGGGGDDGPGDIGGSGGGGAGDAGEGSSKKRDGGDNRRVLEDDKFALKGMFANDIVGRVLPASPEAGFLA